MRMLVTVEMDTKVANKVARDGKLAETIGMILEEQKPEAAYFIAQDGKRTGLLIVDLPDVSDIPALAEPWFLVFNAAITATPAMVVDDLKKAGAAIEAAVKKYG